MRIYVKLDRDWVCSGNLSRGILMQRFVSVCKNRFEKSVQVKAQSFFDCTLEIRVDMTKEAVADAVQELAAEIFRADAEEKSIYTITVNGEEEKPAPQKTENKAPSTEAPDELAALQQYIAGKGGESTAEEPVENSDETEEDNAIERLEEDTTEAAQENSTLADETAETSACEEKSAIAKIDALVGAEDYKKLCHEIAKRAEIIRQNRTQKAFFSEAYLFFAAPGCGYTTALELLSELLTELKLFDAPKEVAEFELPSPEESEAKDKLHRLAESVKYAMEAHRILSFDITQWQGKMMSSAFKRFLMTLAQANEKSVIVFRCKVAQPDARRDVQHDLDDIITTRVVEIPPFTPEEQRAIAAQYLKQYGFTADEASWELFEERVTLEHADGFFYGLHTIRKVANEMIRCTELYSAEHQQNEKMIVSEALRGFVPQREAEALSGMEMLDSLVGMEEIKKQLNRILRQVILSTKSDIQHRPCIHMRFVGNPGTGKTTVARILGKLLNENGILRIGKFFEHKGRDLCGSFVGHTAPKTTEICRQAYGSVLFIDEAYSLYRDGYSGNDYGREAIDTLIAEMENHSDDLLVILAGYPDDMDELMSANAGLASRVPYTIRFPNYSKEQLHQIFMNMCHAQFRVTEELETASKHYFDDLPDAVLQAKSFGNARFVRNLFERVWSNAADRCQVSDISQIELTVDDLNAATKELTGEQPKVKETRKIGFSQ